MDGAVTFTVPGKIQAWQRAGRKNGITFTKKETRNYEALVKMAASQAMQGRAPLCGALSFDVRCVFAVPASWSKKKQAAALAGSVRPTGRPDYDNLAKGISDACNEIVYRDDALIVDAIVRKVYGPIAQAIVTVTPIGEAA
jgi:Holliday junction resolvase RusA-like endonuclease